MPVCSTVNSERYHFPLTLDMDGCGWSRAHLCDSFSHTHTLAALLLSLSHPWSRSHIQFEASMRDCASVMSKREKETFFRVKPPSSFFSCCLLSSSSFTPIMQLCPLIAPSSLVVSRWLNEISCFRSSQGLLASSNKRSSRHASFHDSWYASLSLLHRADVLHEGVKLSWLK